MKKTITLITAILLLVSFSVCYAAEMNFTDVKSDDWFYKNLQELTAKSIASGYPDGTFKPGSTLKFEEFIKMLVAAVEEQPIEVKEGQEWYQPYMEVAESNKYIAEQQKALLGQNISRGTMAEILYNTLTEKENIKEFTDAELQYLSDRLTDVNKTDIKTLTINGIGVISGYPDSTFKPDNTLTRAEAVAVISRVINPELRSPVTMPDTRTLDELPSVDLSHLYDIPTLLGKTVEEENNTQWNSDFGNVPITREDAEAVMSLLHNIDYKIFTAERKQWETNILPYLNAYKEYKGKEYGEGLKAEAIEFYTQRNRQDMIDYILSLNTHIEDFFDIWAKDIIDNKVKVTSKFYTDDNLVITADGFKAVRGILRIKYDNHLAPDNIKNELDLVNSLSQEKGKDFSLNRLGTDNSAYGIYLDYNKVPNFTAGKWYEIEMDVVVASGGIRKGLNDMKGIHNRQVYDFYRYVYPIAIREIK